MVTSDEEVEANTQSRKWRRRNKKTKQKTEETENVETLGDNDETVDGDDKIPSSDAENFANEQGDEGLISEDDGELSRTKSVRNYWLKMQLEQRNDLHNDEDEVNENEDVQNIDAEMSEEDPEKKETDSPELEQESKPKNEYRMSAFAKNYWLMREQAESNENQEDEEFLDAEGDMITTNDEENVDETNEGEVDANNDDNEDNNNYNEIEEIKNIKRSDSKYRMSNSVKNFWLKLERSENNEDENEVNQDESQDNTEYNDEECVEPNHSEAHITNLEEIVTTDDDGQDENELIENKEKDKIESETEEGDSDGPEIAMKNETEDEIQQMANELEPNVDKEIEQEQTADSGAEDSVEIVENSEENQEEDNNATEETEIKEENEEDKENCDTIEPETSENVSLRSEISANRTSFEETQEVEAEIYSPNDEDSQENNDIDQDEEPVLRRSIEKDAAQTDDESGGDNFNSNFRYVVRNRRSERYSRKSNDGEPIYQNLAEPLYEEVRLRNPRRSAPEVVMNRESIEALYNFRFRDALSILNALFPSARSSVEIDGLMSVPQQIYDEKSDEDKVENVEENIPASNQTINTRALPKEATTYELEKFEKNALIIFNQEKIDGYKPRLGTHVDVEALTNTFEGYGFEVVEHLDLTRERIFEELKKFSQKNFTEYGCVAVAILTHGSDMGSLRAKDRRFYETDVINFFRTSENLTLVTKPKLIIIQACRGSKSTYAVNVGRATTIRKDHDDMHQPKTYTLPVESDFLVLHSTFAGKTSHRDEVHGSWLIQTLCEKINDLSHTLDLESIITEVKREVAIEKTLEEYNRRTTEFDTNKQMPVIVSTLIRKLYLRRFGIAPVVPEAVTDSLVSPVIRYTTCACFLSKFEYLRNCMRYFLEDNEDDVTARGFLNVADAIDDGVEFDAVKEQIAKAMSNHLMEKAKDYDYYKYLYFL